MTNANAAVLTTAIDGLRGGPAQTRSAWDGQMAASIEAWAALQRDCIDRLTTALEDHQQRPDTTRPFYRVSTGQLDAYSVTGAPSALRGYAIFNTGASPAYVKFYDTPGVPAVGVDAPYFVLPIALGANLPPAGDGGVEFDHGMAYAITAGAGPFDTSPVAAGDLHVTIFYPRG